MTRNKQYKKAIRAEAADRGVSYQHVHNEKARTSSAPTAPPPTPDPSALLIGYSFAGAPITHRGDILLHMDNDDPITGLNATLSTMMALTALASGNLPAEKKPQFVIFDADAGLVDIADVLQRVGMLGSYAYDSETSDAAFERLADSANSRRDSLAAMPLKAMMTSPVNARPTIVVSNERVGGYLVGGSRRSFHAPLWWNSRLNLQISVWGTPNFKPVSGSWSAKSATTANIKEYDKEHGSVDLTVTFPADPHSPELLDPRSTATSVAITALTEIARTAADPARRGLSAPVTWDTPAIRTTHAPGPDHRPALRIGAVDTGTGIVPFDYPIADGHGHLTICGPASSGRSTALRSIISVAASHYRPSAISYYILDLTTTAKLRPISSLPNVGAYATRSNTDLAERILHEAIALIDSRAEHLESGRYANIDEYLLDTASTDRYGRMVVMISGLDQLPNNLVVHIKTILERGASAGVHLIASTTSVHYRYEDHTTLLCLAGADITSRQDSEERAAFKALPPEPGYFITRHSAHAFRTARILVPADPQTITNSIQNFVNNGGDWAAPPVHVVPRDLPYDAFIADNPVTDPATNTPVIGINRVDHSPTPAGGRHLMITGGPSSGRTNLTRVYIDAITSHYTPDQAQIYIVDPALGLSTDVDDLTERGYMQSTAAFAYNHATAAATAAHLVARVAERAPTPGTRAADLRAGTFWAGPRLFVIIDNYTMLRTSPGVHVSHTAFDDLADHLSTIDNGITIVLTVDDRAYSALTEGVPGSSTP